MKTLYLLIGPKGSGKTYIGDYINSNTEIHFLSVEPIWLALPQNENGWQQVSEAIAQCFIKSDKVMIENLGAGDGFNHFLIKMKELYSIKLIKVDTDLDLCFRRVKERNNKNHIPVSDDKVKEYNNIASKVVLPWDLVINNNGQQTIEKIKEKILNL